MEYVFHWRIILRYSDFFIQAIYNAFIISLISILLALVFGTFCSVVKRSSIKPLSFLVKSYIAVIRSTPLLVQIYLIYFGLPYLNIVISAFWCGVLALVLNSGAYLAEIIRAGLESIPRGHIEASTALGLNHLQTLRYIILPQTFRKVIPPLIGQFTYLIKDTSILAAIGIYELTNTAKLIHSRTFRPMEPFAVALVIYILLNAILMFIGQRIRRRLVLSG